MRRTRSQLLRRVLLNASSPLAWLIAGSPLAWPSGSEIAAAQQLPARTIERAGAEAVMPGLEAFVDGVVASHMAEHVAGTQVAVVKDGRELLVKGYGIARALPERPVDPERTVFRIASISKTFTWLALMQLSDSGKLRLDDDVNLHLPSELKLPKDNWQKPVRVIDLMNHSAGFEEPVPRDDPSDETLLRSMRETLRDRRPARVREPGQLSVYSNYGAALAGAIVAHVSGMDFESYVEQRIFAPLGMRRTTFREPYGVGAPRGLPLAMATELAEERAQALSFRAGRWQPEPYHYLLPHAPSGSAASTASDMARYMIALLDSAVLEAAAVLSRQSYAILRLESFLPAPGLRGLHHGFFNAPLGKHTKLGYANLSHGGNAACFESYLSLVPELGLGMFVSTNSASGLSLSRDLPEQLVRHYFPLKRASLRLRMSPRALEEYTGEYRDLRRIYTKLAALFTIGDVHTISADESGCLLVPLPRAEPACFVPVGRDLFEKVDGDARLAFKRDAHGRIAYMLGALNAERVRLVDSVLWLRIWLGAGLAAVLGLLIAALHRRRYVLVAAQTRAQRWIAIGMLLCALVWLTFYVAGGLWYLFHGDDPLRDYPQPLLVFGLRVLVGAVSLSVLAILALPLVWRGAGWPLARRVRHTCVVLVLFALCLALQRWNVVGFHYF